MGKMTSEMSVIDGANVDFDTMCFIIRTAKSLARQYYGMSTRHLSDEKIDFLCEEAVRSIMISDPNIFRNGGDA